MIELCSKLDIAIDQAAYMGDDLPDLSAIKTAAVGITVPNVYWLVRENADICTQTPGGKGAVREVADLILAAKGCLDKTLESYQF